MNQRELYADSLKGVLIILVVIGHFIETSKSTINIDIHNFVYLFHMPLFCFISGYFGLIKDKGRLLKKTTILLETYFFFQFVYLTPPLMHNMLGIKEILTVPYMHLWYIFCLAIWRIVLFFIPKVYLKYAILCSFEIGVLCGFCEFIDPRLSLSRCLVFLPYFLLGSYVQQHSSMSLIVKKCSKMLSAIIVVLFTVVVILINSDFGCIVFGAHPYTQIVDTPFHPAIMRILLYITALSLSSSIMTLFHESKILASFGRSTMTIFLWHWMFLMIYQRVGITNTLFDWVAAFGTIILLYYADKCKIVRYVNNPISKILHTILIK